MIKPWITKNNQILNLNFIRAIWIEEVTGGTFDIFAQDLEGIDWRCGEYNSLIEAQTVIGYIYEELCEIKDLV